MKILIVDDSIMMRSLLREFLENRGEEIAGEAANGKQGVEKTRELDPDLIIMDIDMPVMDGIEAAGEILREHRRPLIILAHDISGGKAEKLFQLGAAEVWEKPPFSQFSTQEYAQVFISKLRSLVQGFSPRSAAGPSRQRGARTSGTAGAGAALSPNSPDSSKETNAPSRRIDRVVIGASTGGPEAVRTVLASLPADFPAGIALVQHIEARFAPGYADWLNRHCALRVSPAAGGERLEAGRVYTSPGDRHLILEGSTLRLEDSPPLRNQKPAVDRLFQSAAESGGAAVMGIILTGMGSDGANGAALLRKKGGYVIIQDEETSFIYGMPKAALEAGAASAVLPLEGIGPAMREALRAYR